MTIHHTDTIKGKILIVDDNLPNLRLLSAMLIEMGYSVRAVINGPMALKSVHIDIPDIILLDINMPEMNGYEVCNHLKNDEQTCNIPVIFLSALDEVMNKVEAFEAGGVDYITKPFQVEEVLVRIENQLAIQRANEALRKSEERFRLLAEHVPDILYRYRCSSPRGYEYVSPSVTAILGYTPEEFYQDPDLDLKILHPNSRPILDIVRQSPSSYLETIITHVIRKDGEDVWLEQRNWTIYGESGEQIAIEGIIRDISEQKRAEAKLIQQQQALTILREHERLARELHDNLGQVLGYVNTQAQASRDLLHRGQIAKAGVHLNRLITIAQDAHADIREFILGVAIGTATEQGFFSSLETYLNQFSQIHDLPTRLTIAPEIMEKTFGPAVEVHLMRIIQEALTNVRKHARATSVQITFETANDDVCVVIEDDGQGFNVQQLETPSPGHGRGQRYGFYSMRGRATEIGGSLKIESQPGQGTKVIVHVPLRSRDEPLIQTMRVLLVDDHPLFIEGIQNLLMARGIEVVGTAQDGLEALEKARTLQPDVILMDVEMPQCNGLEATRMIKAEMPTIQIVMLTVSAEDSYLFEAIKSGASGYLLKDLDADDFFELLASLEQGEAPLSPGLASRVLEEFAHQHDADGTQESSQDKGDTDGLTSHEIEVLTLVSQGYTYRQVGEMIGFSERSIKYHMAEIIKRLQVKNRADAVEYARKKGLFQRGDVSTKRG